MAEEKKDFVYLKDLYPIGLSRNPDTRISVAVCQRFERWPQSSSFVCKDEESARKSFPRAFLKRGEEYTFSVPFREDCKDICLSCYRRFYPLFDGRMVVKAVAWIEVENGNPMVGNKYPERVYYFAKLVDFPFLRRNI